MKGGPSLVAVSFFFLLDQVSKRKEQEEKDMAQEELRNKTSEEQSVDDWLPITSSRDAKWWYSAFHNVTAMVGAGVLSLPYAMAELGWYLSNIYVLPVDFEFFSRNNLFFFSGNLSNSINCSIPIEKLFKKLVQIPVLKFPCFS